MIDILIVEDDTELSALLTDFLRNEGYTVSAAAGGEYAIALFEKYGARLVILDINLPDVNGFAVCSKLRENADTPILIVSARTDKADKLNGFDLGEDKRHFQAQISAQHSFCERRYAQSRRPHGRN